LYDQKTDTQAANGDKGKADAVRHADGKHHPLCLGAGHGDSLYVRTMGKGSGQRGDFQNDFTRFFYSYRRHDWVPVWYQTHAE